MTDAKPIDEGLAAATSAETMLAAGHPPHQAARLSLAVNSGYASITAEFGANGSAPTCIADIDLNADSLVGLRDDFAEEVAFLQRLVHAWNTTRGLSIAVLELAGSCHAPDAREWFDAWTNAGQSAAELAERLRRMESQIVRLNYAPATGYVIEHVDGGRWRTMDSMGMPDWTTDIKQALCTTLRAHVDAYAGEDPEDVRVMHVTGERHVDVTRERRLAVTGARTMIETLAHMHCGADPDVPGDMPEWDISTLAVSCGPADDARTRGELADSVAYLRELGLVTLPVPGHPTIVQFVHGIERLSELPS